MSASLFGRRMSVLLAAPVLPFAASLVANLVSGMSHRDAVSRVGVWIFVLVVYATPVVLLVVLPWLSGVLILSVKRLRATGYNAAFALAPLLMLVGLPANAWLRFDPKLIVATTYSATLASVLVLARLTKHDHRNQLRSLMERRLLWVVVGLAGLAIFARAHFSFLVLLTAAPAVLVVCMRVCRERGRIVEAAWVEALENVVVVLSGLQVLLLVVLFVGHDTFALSDFLVGARDLLEPIFLWSTIVEIFTLAVILATPRDPESAVVATSLP